ncbi:MAG: DEAD/DEAH box helicase [Deltaproteobacteria bacterium]|nr:DEAD/DEAH box helicase [Deltaproteobacteria bacterium]
MHHSSSKESQAFYLLDEKVRRWVWDQGWTKIRDAQEKAIPLIINGKSDVIIAAATASGKTEAAFLPICSRLLAEENHDACVVYISPLKALINDQFYRLEQLCDCLHIPIYPWHGDIPNRKKNEFITTQKGILLITPESLESLFVNNGAIIPRLFSKLLYIVVDELHSFIGSERGQQLKSLLHRIEFAIKKKIPRIGLSATIGDMQLASKFIRPDSSIELDLIVSDVANQELKLLLKGYVHNDLNSSSSESSKDEIPSDISLFDIAIDLFNVLRGSSNLIFTNRRKDVEILADTLRRLSEQQHLPNEFWPHHGNLSKVFRKEVEKAIKEQTRPVNIICTSTLEMGIDIGSVVSIAQVGVPPSVASMRQRLGRSGRKEGDPAILRIYINEVPFSKNSSPLAFLRSELVQSISIVKLLLEKWYEPPPTGRLHLSTMVQQLLSLIAQYSGITALQAYNILCKLGPFSKITEQMFASFLRSLGNKKLIIQSNDGLLLHGPLGERIVNHYSFYTAFKTLDEYRLVSANKTLGTFPIDHPLKKDDFLIFAGRRWLVKEIDAIKKTIFLDPSKGGKAPIFKGQTWTVHDRIRQEMFLVYTEKKYPVFLDPQAKMLLAEARDAFQKLLLFESRIIMQDNIVYLFCWTGDRTMNTLTIMLSMKNFKAVNHGIAIAVYNSSTEQVIRCLHEFLKDRPPEAYELARNVENKICEKYDEFINDELRSLDYAASQLDVENAFFTVNCIISNTHT